MTAISVLVCTRNRRDMLHELLRDLARQTYDGDMEIIVVEETNEPVPPQGVCYVPHPVRNRGIAFARNLSVEHASHEVLAFVDDDCRVAPDWLAMLVKPVIEQESVLGLQGGVVVPSDTGAIGWAESLLGFPGGGVTRVHHAKGQRSETLEVSTLNACYRKAAVMKAGGFSDQARFGGEDYLLAKRVAEQGKLLFVPDAVVEHKARGRLPAIWNWFVRRGRAEFDLWNNDLAPKGFGTWMLRSSLALKLLPFTLLCFWSLWPLLMVMALILSMNLWRFRWVLSEKSIPSQAWWWLPWVRITMGLATDVGHLRAWLSRS